MAGMMTHRQFKKFYADNKDRLFGYLFRRTGDYHLAADIMQESFARYFERYKTKELSLPLLFTIGRNLIYDNARKQKKHTSYDEKKQSSGSAQGWEKQSDQEHRLLVRDESRQVLAAMQKLDRDESDILALAVSSSLSYKEIAAVTGISESNVKVKVHRSRIKLRQILGRGGS